MQSATVNPSSVWFFSTVHFHVTLYIGYIKGGIVAHCNAIHRLHLLESTRSSLMGGDVQSATVNPASTHP